jgi:hypothetical protein
MRKFFEKQLENWEKANRLVKVILYILFFVFIFSLIPEVGLLQAVVAVGALSTAVGIFLAYYSLRDSHEWNRRQYTIQFLGCWNECARDHLNVLEKEFPDLLNVPDFIKNPDLIKTWCIKDEEAKKLADLMSHPEENCREMDIRRHLIELFNYFESIANAYEQHVVDRSAVVDCDATAMLDIFIYFQPFIKEMRKINRRDPWPPLSRVAELWLNEATFSKSKVQADEASRRYEEASKRLESKLKKPTGVL